MANQNNEKIHWEDVQNDAPKCLKIRIFWRSFWLQTALKNFLRIFSSRYEYVKCCPRSYLSSALWIMVIQRTNLFLFGKVLTTPVTLDLGAVSLDAKPKNSDTIENEELPEVLILEKKNGTWRTTQKSNCICVYADKWETVCNFFGRS